MTSLILTPTQNPFGTIPMATHAQMSMESWITLPPQRDGQLAAWKNLLFTTTISLQDKEDFA
jgi:hypothetical protein